MRRNFSSDPDGHMWFWPLFEIAYMTALAWVGAFTVFQGGRLLGFQ